MSRTFLITRSYDLFDRIDNIADSRVKQAVALRLAGYAGSVAAYTALGLAAKMAAAIRENESASFGDALELMNDEEQRDWAMDQIGAEYTSRATKIRLMLRLKEKFDDLVRASGWAEYRGRTMDDELARTSEARLVRDQDVDAIVQHFDGDFEARDVRAMLQQDAANEAARNGERASAACIVLAAVGGTEPADDEMANVEAFNTMPEPIRIGLLSSTRAAVMKFEVDLLQGRGARGLSAIEKLATLSEAKAFRKEVTEAVTKLQQTTDLMAA